MAPIKKNYYVRSLYKTFVEEARFS